MGIPTLPKKEVPEVGYRAIRDWVINNLGDELDGTKTTSEIVVEILGSKAKDVCAIKFNDFEWKGSSGPGFHKAVARMCRMPNGPNPLSLARVIVEVAITYGLDEKDNLLLSLRDWIDRKSSDDDVESHRVKWTNSIDLYFYKIKDRLHEINYSPRSKLAGELPYFEMLSATPGVSYRYLHPITSEWVEHNWKEEK